jgi:GTP-binding protein
MFIDEITLHIKAGKGGDGIVAWRHEKGLDKAGPGGGDGGNGGDVYFFGVRDIGALSQYSFEKDFSAEDGGNGQNKGMKGANGKDIFLSVPVGSLIKNTTTGEVFDILTEEKTLVLKGGRGGFGNEHFKGSRNVAPKESTEGKAGEESDFFIELRLVVDIGFIGFPNAGKSSLLNTLTNAKAKVGSYQFTTLTPNVGDFYGYILADIPGLIENASVGKGLGFKFLRHVSRTKMLMHCISVEHDDMWSAYQTIRKEIDAFSAELSQKKEHILLTKTDLVSDDMLQEKIEVFREKGLFVHTISIIDNDSIKDFSDSLAKILKEL